jgi:phage protein D
VNTFTAPDGTQIPYMARRLLPDPASFTAISSCTVVAGDRPDLVAFKILGDPGQWWQIAISRIHLTLMIGNIIPVPVRQPLTDALLSAQVTVTAGQASGFQLVFDLAKNELINRHLLPCGYFDPKTRVILVVTVSGTSTVLMDGVITQQEVDVANEAGSSTLTITGQDLTVLMDLVEKNSDSFPGTTDADRATRVISLYAQYGITPDVQPEIFPYAPSPDVQTDFQQGTDLAYLNQLAQDNGFVFYLDPGPLPGHSVGYWGPEKRSGTPQPALTINSDAASNVEQLTFTFDGTARQDPKALVQNQMNRVPPVPVPPPALTRLYPPLARKPAPALKQVLLDDTAKENTQQILAQLLALEAQSADAITVSGTLDVVRYGQVLRPRELVGVRGAGVTYDGSYYVTSVTHNLKRGEYTQDFTLAREGLISLDHRVIP